MYKSKCPFSLLFLLSVNILVCASDPKSPQASSVLFSFSVLPLRLLFAYVKLLPALSAKLQMLVPLFSPNHLIKPTEEEGGKKLRDRERLRGKKGGSPVEAVKSFFSLHLSSFFFPHPPPCLFLCISPSPLLPLLLSLSLYLSISLVLTVEWGLMSVQRLACQLVNIPKENISNRSCDQLHMSTHAHNIKMRSNKVRIKGGIKGGQDKNLTQIKKLNKKV